MQLDPWNLFPIRSCIQNHPSNLFWTSKSIDPKSILGFKPKLLSLDFPLWSRFWSKLLLKISFHPYYLPSYWFISLQIKQIHHVKLTAGSKKRQKTGSTYQPITTSRGHLQSIQLWGHTLSEPQTSSQTISPTVHDSWGTLTLFCFTGLVE